MKKLMMMIGAAAVAAGANASSITIDSVTQRWPWNNKFDITYTVTDGQLLTADGTGDVYCKIVFNATIGGQTYEIDGVTNIGASANSGTHTVTWTPPSSLRAKDMSCTMTATLMSATAPSGDDYMVVDLDDGTVSFEGMLHSQDLSNARYNTGDTYKTDKMVLRKVPRWAKKSTLPNAASLTSGGYPTGYSSASPVNTPATWQTKNDYYAGVFMVTVGQFKKLFGGTSADADTKPIISSYSYNNGGSTTYICYNYLRRDVAPTADVPVIESNTGVSFLQRLNFKTGHRFVFDLPTLVMSEIAARAGQTGQYVWPDGTTPSNYAVVENDTGYQPVGSREANDWGLYDVAGNGYEICLDQNTGADPSSASDAFTPLYSGSWTSSSAEVRMRGGPRWGDTASKKAASYFEKIAAKTANGYVGFRVFVVMK